MKFRGPVLLERGECPYLPDRFWRSLSLQVDGLDPGEFETLLEAGFRRCGTEFYVPRCLLCSACIPIRLPVERFRPSRTQRRVWRANQDLEVAQGEPRYTAEKLHLYRRYLKGRFGREELPGRREYEYFLGSSFGNTVEFQYRLAGRLVGLGVVDATPRAASSVYCAYDPDLPRRRLGTFSLLYEVEWCRRSGREHLYLGLYVGGCRSMRYKASFRPHEILLPGRGWHEPEKRLSSQERAQKPRDHPPGEPRASRRETADIPRLSGGLQ